LMANTMAGAKRHAMLEHRFHSFHDSKLAL
jgi:hypothetical protein